MALGVTAACGGSGDGADRADPVAEAPDEAVHEIVFVGEIPDHLQETIRHEAELAVNLLGGMFGITPPETTITFTRTRDELADAYRQATGGEVDPQVRCFAERLPGDRYAIFIHIANCGFGYTVGDNVSLVLAHEYFHVLQLLLSPELNGPRWLIEGSAEYAMAHFGHRANRYDYTAFRNSVLLRAASWTGTLRDAGNDLTYPTGHEHYFLGFLAVELLVEQADEEAVLEYFRLLPAMPDWRDAFAGAFGTTADEFYETFEESRREALANYRTIRGRVVGAYGEPRDGVTLWAFDRIGNVGGFGEPAPDGTFSIGLTRNGSYRVEVYAVDESGLCNLVGWYERAMGLTTTPGDATYLAVEGGHMTGIEIPLPQKIEFNPQAGYCFQ
jgi:hypothetical protein